MFKSKKIYEMSVAELNKRSKIYAGVFWSYVILAVVVAFITGFFGINSINNVMSLPKDGTFLLLLSVVLLSINTMWIVLLWFINESSYYKMLQLNADMMIYFKGKLGE